MGAGGAALTAVTLASPRSRYFSRGGATKVVTMLMMTTAEKMWSGSTPCVRPMPAMMRPTSPRIRDLADQRLYRVDRQLRYRHIEPLLAGTINRERILRRWDELLRVAASLKQGWVTASLLISKLQRYRRRNALLGALLEHGRLIKSLHIVRCLDSPDHRRGIGRQLNKGESLHDLRGFLFFANEGEIRRAQHADQAVQALCLNLVTNAVIAWNTVYMAEVLRALRVEGYPVDDDDLRYLAPTLRAHVNIYGTYRFDLDAGAPKGGLLRPLHQPPAASA